MSRSLEERVLVVLIVGADVVLGCFAIFAGEASTTVVGAKIFHRVAAVGNRISARRLRRHGKGKRGDQLVIVLRGMNSVALRPEFRLRRDEWHSPRAIASAVW